MNWFQGLFLASRVNSNRSFLLSLKINGLSEADQIGMNDYSIGNLAIVQTGQRDP